MASDTPTNISDAIDAARLSALQIWVLALCTLVIVLDGFDVQAIAFAAPALAEAWQIPRLRMGPLFSAGLIGMAIGALVGGPLGDRFGRRAAIHGSVFAFGLFSLLSAFADNYSQLFALRLLTGLGLGGALPNATALMTEYAPRRLRNLAVAIIFLGIPLGGIFGGLLAGVLIPFWGWPAVFVGGGVLPLGLLPLLVWLLPESTRYLATRGDAGQQRIAKLMARIDPACVASDGQRFVTGEPEVEGFPIARLFDAGYRADTVWLWLAFFTNLMVIYFLISWIPLLVKDAGHATQLATRTAILVNLGGAVGHFVIAWIVGGAGSRRGLGCAFVLGAAAVATTGQVTATTTLMLCGFLAGLFTFGGQVSLNALAASMYPTGIRATGVGWALGIGRLGSILGPLIGGLLIGLGLGMPVYFLSFAAVLLATFAASQMIKRHQPRLSVADRQR